jgi:branched-chain amino acid transport system substrate-binding protein
MKKYYTILIGILILAAVLVACAPKATEAPAAVEEPAAVVEEPAAAAEEEEAAVEEPKEPILIGNLQDESGGMAVLSTPLTYAATMKIEEINAAGGINGRMLQLVTYDTRSDVTEAINAYTRMVEQDNVPVVLGPPISNIGIAVAPVAEELKVPIVGLFMVEAAFKQESGVPWTYMFLAQNSDKTQGQIMGQYSYDQLGVRRTALLYNSQNSYSVGIAMAYKDKIIENGGEVVMEETYTWTDQDFRAQLTKIIAEDPDSIFFPGYPAEIPLILAQAYELGYEGLMLSDNSVPPTGLSPNTDPEANKRCYYPYGINPNDPVLADWAATYEAEFGVPPLAQSFSGADAFGMIVAAIEACGDDVTSECITQELNNIKAYPGFQGTFDMSPTGHEPSELPMAMMKVVDGQQVFDMWYLASGPAGE